MELHGQLLFHSETGTEGGWFKLGDTYFKEFKRGLEAGLNPPTEG